MKMMVKCGYEMVKRQIDQHPMWNNIIPSFCFAITKKKQSKKTKHLLTNRTASGFYKKPLAGMAYFPKQANQPGDMRPLPV